MNTLVRQVAVLSVLWALCELLLPDGRYQRMVRLTASLLVMAALLSTVGDWLGMAQTAQPAAVVQVQQASEKEYLRTALEAAANQLENWCVQTAKRAGYQAEACVWLQMDGGLDHIDLWLRDEQNALLAPEELRAAMAERLHTDAERIRITTEGL